MTPTWSPNSWRSRPIKQVPAYPSPEKLAAMEAKLRTYPPLVFAGEARRLKAALGQVADGRAFVLQGGDCAESFSDFTANIIRDTFRVLLQMAVVLTFGASVPVVKMGRMAGQFAKPRSSDTETIGGETLPSYRGDIINGPEFTPEARIPDPARMELGYFQSAGTLNLLRAFATGGYADLHEVHRWNLGFRRALAHGGAIPRLGTPHRRNPRLHAGLRHHQPVDAADPRDRLLHQPRGAAAAVRAGADPRRQHLRRLVRLSAHFLWVGDRTRQPDGAHVEFLRGVENPLGLKVGPSTSVDDLLRLIDTLNPENEPGRLTLISRMGAEKVERLLPPLVRAVRREGRRVVWLCDAMHGNTISTAAKLKTRNFDAILPEVRGFFDVHAAEGTWAGGVHVEMTGRNVTECVGGAHRLTEADLSQSYETFCDPRLNAEQSLELAFLVAEELKARRQPARELPAVAAQ